MGKYFCSEQISKNHRRINGLQLPLNFQQITCWILLFATALINFAIISLIQFEGLKIISIIIYAILYTGHIVSHVAALTIDPAEQDLRHRETSEVPEFDRNQHAHVIENGRCHLCNLYTSSKKTKHCGLCNKCVYEFDHHCKWLNNCIGQRNYAAFIGCVTTALFISTFTFILCIVDIVLFYKQPELLSSEAQKFFNCNSTSTVKLCQSSITFLIFLVILCICGIALSGALLHLCCFHIYISFLGVSTYEYIVKNSNTKKTGTRCCELKRKTYLFNKAKEKDLSQGHRTESSESKTNVDKIHKNQANVTHLINILIESEVNKAISMFSSDNKIHPHQDSAIT